MPKLTLIYMREIEHEVRNAFDEFEWILLHWHRGAIDVCVVQLHEFAKRLRAIAGLLEGVELS